MIFITTCHFAGKAMSVIEKKAQIKILYHIKDRFCNGELPEAGKRAVDSLIANLKKEIDDTISTSNTSSDGHFYCDN